MSTKSKTLTTIAVWIVALLVSIFGGFAPPESPINQIVSIGAIIVAATVTIFIWLQKPRGGA